MAGGRPSGSVGTLPWSVSILKSEAGIWKHHCGGSLIDENFVITSAHCTEDKHLKMRFGDRDLGSASDNTEVQVAFNGRVIAYTKGA